MLDLEFIWVTLTSSHLAYISSDLFNRVAYDPAMLYSTLIIAILLTKGYGKPMGLAIGRKLLHEPTKKIWRTLRAIKPRQIMYYGLRWGIPLYQLRELVTMHKKLLKKGQQGLFRRAKRNRKVHEKTQRLNSTVTLYRKMPLKAMSRAWGKFNELDLPTSLRKPLLGLYVWMFGVNLREAQDEDLKNYRNLSEFFRRQLKPEARVLDMASPMTSPSDGKILHFGKCEQGVVEQVKGVNYALKGFLGPMTWKDKDMVDSSRVTDAQYQDYLDIKPGHSLYHCIIYLAPGDYHRFHSPVDWNITYRRHFPGELLSVNPGIARWIQGLFNMNERVVYTGQWEHGFFSYTAVGATNVGSIKIYCDKDLTTNIGKAYPESVYYDKNMCENNYKGVQVSKGEMVGEFNLGSTIVLLFEAPENFQFTVQAEQKVLFGEPIGQFVSG